MLEGEGTLIGPELYHAISDVARGGHDRIAVFAGNRVAWSAIAVMLVGSALFLLGGVDLAAFLVGR
jgi:predicted ThiF/HesA family dinucleotide-utilizing enzyme